MSDHDPSDVRESSSTDNAIQSTLATGTWKVLGELTASDGTGVLGRNLATAGAAVGVTGTTAAPNGYGLATPDDARIEGTVSTVDQWLVTVNGLRSLLHTAENPAGDAGTVLAGHSSNTVAAGVDGATIAGGGFDDGTVDHSNTVLDDYGVVAGGRANRTGRPDGDPTSSPYATVGGGSSNAAAAEGATVGGGMDNDATASFAIVGGGTGNTASGAGATVGGGENNSATGSNSVVGGGERNSVTNNGNWSTVGGGRANAVEGGLYATVGGGWNNDVRASFATIAGGGPSDTSSPFSTRNVVLDAYGTVGGGGDNQAGSDDTDPSTAPFATVGGGLGNSARNGVATVGGGSSNAANGLGSTVSGGSTNLASHQYSSVGGGFANKATADAAVVGGGENNTASGEDATVSGGGANVASGDGGTIGGGGGNDATGLASTVGGGGGNVAGGQYTTIGGGEDNETSATNATVGGGERNVAGGVDATVPGGGACTANGDFSFATGRRGKSLHSGAFVWADANGFDFESTGQNTWNVRSTGGARFISAIDGSGNPTAGVTLASGSGTWGSLSARSAKENVHSVDPASVLENVCDLDIGTWNYCSQDNSIQHMGPMAEDFQGAFGLGADEERITAVDADGVALAAIQGLSEKLEEKDDRIHKLEKENDKLRDRLAEVEDHLGLDEPGESAPADD